MKPYSADFRQKIVETKEKTNESIQQLADRFQVSYSFVNRLIKRYEATKSVEPKTHGGGNLFNQFSTNRDAQPISRSG